ncbi:MAG: phosphotransferase [Candidatus Reddybacter sp.]
MATDSHPEVDNVSPISADLDRVKSQLLPAQVNKKFPATTNQTIDTVRTLDLPYSSIRVLQVANPPGPAIDIFLKRITIPGKEQSIIKEALIRETHLLEKLNKYLPEESVELIASFPEQQTIATKGCAGNSIDELINAHQFWWQPGLKSKAQRQRLAQLCGDWLKRFHALTEQNDQLLKPWYDYLNGEMDWRTQALQQGQTRHASLYRKVADKFYSDLREQEQYAPTNIYHGDFAPHNIFDNQHKITVIDFFGAQTGSKLMDLINFIASIASRGENPLYPKGRISTFCQQFIAAYNLAPNTQDSLAAPLLVLQSVKRLLVLKNTTPHRIDQQYSHRRSTHWHHQYLENYFKGNDSLVAKGPWPFLDLSTFTRAKSNNPKH